MSSLLDKEVLLLDGGLGTTLEDQHGVKFTEQTPLWSSHLLITDPDTLEKVQTEFVQAGADIILTPTYQASHAGFEKTVVNGERVDYFEEICQYFDLGVDISRHVFNNQPGLVALSLGAYGATLNPSQEYGGQYGDMDETKLEHWHVARIAMFYASWDKVDLVAFETIPRLDEVRAVKTAANVNRNSSVFKPYWVSCVFPTDNKLPDGSSIEQIVQVLLEPKMWHDDVSYQPPFAIGINCTAVHMISDLVKEYEQAAEKLGYDLPKLVIYPDGAEGQVYNTSTKEWIGSKSTGSQWEDEVYSIVEDVRKRGKWKGIIVGGCCKTTPQHIARLRKRIDRTG